MPSAAVQSVALGTSLTLQVSIGQRNSEIFGQLSPHQLVESWLELLTALGQVGFVAVPQRRYSRWFLHNDEVVVHENQPHAACRDGRRQWAIRELKNITDSHPSLGIDAQVAVHLHTAASDQLAHVRPGLLGQKPLKRSGERQAAMLVSQMEIARRHILDDSPHSFERTANG